MSRPQRRKTPKATPRTAKTKARAAQRKPKAPARTPQAPKAADARASAPSPAQAVEELVRSKRFLAADRAGLDVSEVATWDHFLLREHRLLVPIDVQALYVPEGSAEAMVRLPMLVAGANGQAVEHPEDGMPEPFAAGSPRPAGVYLHWALPDALLRGNLTQVPDGSPNRLGLPALPDRWVVLRLALPNGATSPVVSGWVLEADRAIAVPLDVWKEGVTATPAPVPAGVAVDRGALTGTLGGALTWSGVYDAVLNRFAFYDSLADLDTVAPKGVDGDSVAYVVAGWWSDPGLDVLDSARSDGSLHELLDQLRWRLLYEWGSEAFAQEEEREQAALRQALGLTTNDRWSSPRPPPVAKTAVSRRARAAAAATPFVPVDPLAMQKQTQIMASSFATEASERFVAPPWELRSSLLQGAIYGVPVRGAPPVDLRPAPTDLGVALGWHEDDLLGAFASAPDATLDERRATERLLSAFTAQKITRLASADGVVELEEHEHAAAFASLPAGSAGTDRFLQRVQTGGVGGLNIGKDRPGSGTATKVSANARAARAGRSPRASAGGDVLFAASGKPTLIKATQSQVFEVARSRVGDVLTPTEARVLDRPAPRFTFPSEPLVALRGASRSLRHGSDGRGSADGKLTCRWPTHVITEIPGIVAEDRFIASLGNGSVPSEALTLAREALLHDPYHDAWIAAALAPPGTARATLLNRLQAESALRFGLDGTYDGATAAFSASPAKVARGRRGRSASTTKPVGEHEQQTLVADELRKYSLYQGADPDLVAVTAWAQPWVPMWLEWELTVQGVDPPALDAWTLGTLDLDVADATFSGTSVTLRGRAPLTAGAASTLDSAISDWLKNEDALGENADVDAATEDAYRTLDAAVKNLDVVTAALDGVRTQLLGLAVSDGLRRPGTDDGGVSEPAPIGAPHALVAGSIELSRARVLDAFGRTLDVPLTTVLTPTRASLDDRPGLLEMRPRLLRPARWLFRLVDAATAVGSEGVEARIDEVEPALQVNPVAGYLLPDHLDESLEVFGADGAPLGELLHEPVSGGVTWEIAAGRTGPADAGPAFDLTPAERPLGDFAAALVAADAAARAGSTLAASAQRESALSALLRAIDTTLWTVDTFASLGSEHVAGLVGRPIAVVRAQLRLELRPPVDVDLSDPARAAEWAAAETEAQSYAFPVRIGELTRSDDGVLGFFVDDDYAHFRLVDKVIAAVAADAGRSRGQLGLYEKSGGMPPPDPIDHPYIAGTDAADTLLLHLGQTVTLTILMHPAGKATLTSGILPRRSLALARDWVGPGLAAIAPSLRTGPVLVETDLDPQQQVRLPKVSVFGKDQNFLWRDTPATWRTDAILAATQTALLPDAPAEFREGWIRVAPTKPEGAT